MEHLILLAQALLVAGLAGWLGIGAFENIRVPRANADMVADVIAMRVIRAESPELFRLVGGNRIESPLFHRFAFAAIVIAESLSVILMTAGSLGLLGALAGFWAVEPAKIIAAAGVLGFTMVWSGFLVGGQWFHYFLGHQEAQHTHFMLAIWGVVVFGIVVGF
ncbi:MAG: DUF2165 family protein [Rhizobiales bacterium]|nr:DUF2165 family protein [Hyphomicrobiales bacterium]